MFQCPYFLEFNILFEISQLRITVSYFLYGKKNVKNFLDMRKKKKNQFMFHDYRERKNMVPLQEYGTVFLNVWYRTPKCMVPFIITPVNVLL